MAALTRLIRPPLRPAASRPRGRLLARVLRPLPLAPSALGRRAEAPVEREPIATAEQPPVRATREAPPPLERIVETVERTRIVPAPAAPAAREVSTRAEPPAPPRAETPVPPAARPPAVPATTAVSPVPLPPVARVERSPSAEPSAPRERVVASAPVSEPPAVRPRPVIRETRAPSGGLAPAQLRPAPAPSIPPTVPDAPLRPAAAPPVQLRLPALPEPRPPMPRQAAPQPAAPIIRVQAPPTQPVRERVVHTRELVRTEPRTREVVRPAPAPMHAAPLRADPAAPSTPSSRAPVTIEIGRVEIRTAKPAPATLPPLRATPPRAHAIDPGLRFGGGW